MSTSRIDETHDPNLKSWVESANDPATDFPIQNLPLCAMLHQHEDHAHRHLGVVIGDQILDISMLIESGLFNDGTYANDYAVLLRSPYANFIAALDGMSRDLRARAQRLLRSDIHVGQQARRVRQKALVPLADANLVHATSILNYTDFYASKHHAANVGSMFRPDNPLLPNYKHIPIAYHGRTSSIIVSGTPVTRPSGQMSPPDDNPAAMPTFGPCKMLDYELELGVIVGLGTELGKPVPIDHVRSQMFGMCLVNDWSARDIQKWEYQPLGPFLAKNFATTVSPFIVTMEALEPFRIPGPERDETDPQPLEYLRSSEDWGLDITVEAWLSSQQMRDRGTPAHMLSKGNFKHMYWTIAQMLTHHASGGCNFRSGDLLASGTISGPSKDSRGCLLELTWDGLDPATKKPKPRVPIQLPTGETRTFLADGDEVILKAYCEREGYRRIGFGECRGIVVARSI